MPKFNVRFRYGRSDKDTVVSPDVVDVIEADSEEDAITRTVARLTSPVIVVHQAATRTASNAAMRSEAMASLIPTAHIVRADITPAETT